MDECSLVDFEPLDKIYWFRLVSGISAGIFCGILKLTDLPGLTVGIGIYLLTYYLVRYQFKIGLEEAESETRFYTIGIGVYFLSWFTLWVLIHTLSYAGVF
jgi:hypothetical protein